MNWTHKLESNSNNRIISWHCKQISKPDAGNFPDQYEGVREQQRKSLTATIGNNKL